MDNGRTPTTEVQAPATRDTATTVAVLGTGTMGTPIARRLADAGFQLRVWNRTPARAHPLAGDGATVTDSPAEAAQGADVVLTMLSDADATEATMRGSAGALGAMAAGAVWLQMGTIGPRATDGFVELAEQHAVELVDAPVSGSDAVARAGELIVLASGPDRVRERVQSLLDAVGRRTLWLGPAGAGSRLKLVLNNWLACLVEATAETLTFAGSLDLDPRIFLEAIEGGPLAAPYVVTKSKAMLEHDYTPGFPLHLALKDVGLALAAAGEAGIDLPLTEALAPQWRRVADAGYADFDLSAVIIGRPSTA
jgi:3-hydroxyisobutyrate dehydrogenase